MDRLEDTVDPWIEKLWQVLPTVLQRDENVSADQQLEEDLSELQIRQVDIPYSMDYRKSILPNGVDKYLNLKHTLVDNYTMDARREKLPTEVLKYVDLDNTLVINDDEPEKQDYKSFPFKVCLNDLVPGTKLTGLPRVSAPTAKLIPLEGQTTQRVSDKVPEFVSTPVPITYAPVTMVCCLTTSDAVKRTLEVELDIGKDGHFEPGDAFGVLAPNNEQLVQAILARLNASTDQLYKLDGENLPSHLQKASSVTLGDLFRYGVDLTSPPRKTLFRMLADFTSDPTERLSLMYLASKQGVFAFNAVRQEAPNLLDILASFPSTQPPIERLLDLLPAHLPRFYSISSSPLKRPGKIRFAFNIVEYVSGTNNTQRHGVATPWLDKLTELVPSRTTPDKREIPVTKDIRVPMYIRPNANAFILPKHTEKPLVLIGPGTGIAPFIGFLEHRQMQRAHGHKLGPIHVYYGYRDRYKDYLFREELQQFEKDGTITKLRLAESRASDGTPKVYVQDLITRDMDVLYNLVVEKDGAVYICGDAKGMAKGVQDALADMLVKHKKMDVVDANKLLMQWVTDKKYLRDLASIFYMQ